MQLAALGKAVVAGDLRTFVDSRITTEFFPDDQYRRVYSYLLDHLKDYGVAPDVPIVKQSFPNLLLEDHPQPTLFFVDQLRERREGVLQMEALREAMDLFSLTDEPAKVPKIRQVIENHLRQVALETSGSRDVTLASEAQNILERLSERRKNPGYLRGYSTGFPGIDYVTGGLQPEQFIVVTGVPKSGKSSFLLYMALTMFERGFDPEFLGFEMSNEEQADRIVSLRSHVSLTRILNGTLDDGEWMKIEEQIAWFEKGDPLPSKKRLRGQKPLFRAPASFFLSADITSGMTVAGVAAKIHKNKPSAVFIDGLYLMSAGDEKQYPRGSEAAMRMISRDLKKLAQSSRIPVVGTTQSLVSRSRGGLTIASLGYTSAWGQDADLILGVERIPNTNVSKFHVMESRSGPRADTFIAWDWDQGSVTEIQEQNFGPAARAQVRMDDGIGND